MRTVLVLGDDQMGQGDRELGRKILTTMLRKAAGAFGELEGIAFYNAGVKLVCDGSPVLVELTQLHEAGVELLPCGTCLDHYGLAPRIGDVADMDTILRELAQADKVIRI